LPTCKVCKELRGNRDFTPKGSEICRKCLGPEEWSVIEQRYPNVSCFHCGESVHNLIRHFKKKHQGELWRIDDLCKANTDEAELSLNNQVLQNRARVNRDCTWDPNISVVYFVQAGITGRPIKIGYAQQMASRMVSLQLSSPEPLEVLLTVAGDRGLEKTLHHKFAHLRIHQEWFLAKAELLETILEMGRTHSAVPERSKGALYVGEHRSHKRPKFTYLECQSVARELGVQSAAQWRELHRSKKLPKGMLWNPPRTYPKEWVGWAEFLSIPQDEQEAPRAKQNGPRFEKPGLTYAECQQVARDLGIESAEGWLTSYRTGKLPKGAPWKLSEAYPRQWLGWTEFLHPTFRAERAPVFDEPPFEDSADMSVDDLLRASGLSLD